MNGDRTKGGGIRGTCRICKTLGLSCTYVVRATLVEPYSPPGVIQSHPAPPLPSSPPPCIPPCSFSPPLRALPRPFSRGVPRYLNSDPAPPLPSSPSPRIPPFSSNPPLRLIPLNSRRGALRYISSDPAPPLPSSTSPRTPPFPSPALESLHTTRSSVTRI